MLYAMRVPVPSSPEDLAHPRRWRAPAEPFILDIGANIGWFMVNAAARGARVAAFEGARRRGPGSAGRGRGRRGALARAGRRRSRQRLSPNAAHTRAPPSLPPPPPQPCPPTSSCCAPRSAPTPGSASALRCTAPALAPSERRGGAGGWL
jgi:hypothetical protein